MSKELVRRGETWPDTSNLLRDTFQGVLEGVTGLASSDKKDLVRSVGFIFQRWRSLGFLQALQVEWNRYKKEGRIKDDYQKTEQHVECLQEILDLIDNHPDQIRFEALKKILLIAATEKYSYRDSLLPQQYMRLIRELNSGEVLVLLTTYTLAKRSDWLEVVKKENYQAEAWLQEVAEESHLRYPELVAVHEEKLMAKNLLTSRVQAHPALVNRPPHNRLTQLGYELCEFVSHYDAGD